MLLSLLGTGSFLRSIRRRRPDRLAAAPPRNTIQVDEETGKELEPVEEVTIDVDQVRKASQGHVPPRACPPRARRRSALAADAAGSSARPTALRCALHCGICVRVRARVSPIINQGAQRHRHRAAAVAQGAHAGVQGDGRAGPPHFRGAFAPPPGRALGSPQRHARCAPVRSTSVPPTTPHRRGSRNEHRQCQQELCV